MTQPSHGYLPAKVEEDGETRVGFQRKALADMSPAELTYIAEMGKRSTQTMSRTESEAIFKDAFAKLQASTQVS